MSLLTDLDIVSEACWELATGRNDFWVLAGLTDDSYEEGVRNTHFRRRVQSYENAGCSKELSAILRDGINGNLQKVIENRNRDIPNVKRTVGKGQDLSWGPVDGVDGARIEVKQVYDCTMTKYYGSVAADWEKLHKVRTDGYKGGLFLVVFFTQFPEFKRPGGQWEGNERQWPSRSSYLIKCGIDRQFVELKKRLVKPITWPAEEPRLHALHVPAEENRRVVETRYARFRPSSPWQLEWSTHLMNAKVGVGIWEIPKI